MLCWPSMAYRESPGKDNFPGSRFPLILPLHCPLLLLLQWSSVLQLDRNTHSPQLHRPACFSAFVPAFPLPGMCVLPVATWGPSHPSDPRIPGKEATLLLSFLHTPRTQHGASHRKGVRYMHIPCMTSSNVQGFH